MDEQLQNPGLKINLSVDVVVEMDLNGESIDVRPSTVCSLDETRIVIQQTTPSSPDSAILSQRSAGPTSTISRMSWCDSV
jgi:hypothetical protein